VRLLALDTSTAVTACALLDDDRPIWVKRIEPPLKAGEVLPAALGDLEGVQGVAVGLGPGSFTGLRVGLAAAKAIAYALKLPLAGASSLHALALDEAGLVCAATDARKGELFVQNFRDGEPQDEVRVVMAAGLDLHGARLVKGAPNPASVARLCLPKLKDAAYDAAQVFALAPEYHQGFANLT
jgi:tRNA threonylcarbamoyl adenosine modification protein YeaZ